MSETTQPTSEAQVKADEGKKHKVRKPKIVKAPGSFRFGTQSVVPAATYGPCAFEVTISTRNVIGDDGEVEKIRTFCQGFSEHADHCSITGYGVRDASWIITLDLNTGGRDVDDNFVAAMFLQLKDYFETTPVLKADFGAGKATYRFLNGGTTVEAGSLN